MPELSLLATSPLPQTPPQSSPTTSASPAIIFSRLTRDPDQKFLDLLDHEAGRAVILEIYATTDMTGEQKRALWQRYQRSGVNLTQLGLAAKALERAGWNWREAKSPGAVHKAAKTIPKGSVN